MLRRGVKRVEVAVTTRGDREVEAMQMQRMLGRVGIDDSPANRIADSVTQAFSVRPARAIDHHLECRLVVQPRIVVVEPSADQHDALTARRRRARGINDQCAHERAFALLTTRPVIGHRCDRMLNGRPHPRPVVERSRRCQPKRDVRARASSERYRVSSMLGRVIVEAENHELHTQRVVQRDVHDCPGGRAQQRPWHLGGLPVFDERECIDLGAPWPLGAPAHLANADRRPERVGDAYASGAAEILELREWPRCGAVRWWSGRDGTGRQREYR